MKIGLVNAAQLPERKVLLPPRLARPLVGAAVSAATLLILVWIGYLGVYDIQYAESIADDLLAGLVITLQAVAIVIPVGFVLGFLMGWARTARSWFLRVAGTTYVEFFRSMPPLVLIVFASLIVTLIIRTYLNVEDPHLIALSVGILALALHSGSYQAEIVRAGLLSVPAGQVEAADALGLSRFQTMFRVTLPQAFRVSLPALGNEFASVIKDTSLISAIGALELSFRGTILVRGALKLGLNHVFIIWVEVALLYFVLTTVVTIIVRRVENRSKVPGLEAASL
jgi:His/Glu/Gln/Arg/opine family amino acid ABC transporter permease subunit